MNQRTPPTMRAKDDSGTGAVSLAEGGGVSSGIPAITALVASAKVVVNKRANFIVLSDLNHILE